MADGDKQGGMKANMDRVLAQRTPVEGIWEHRGTSPQTRGTSPQTKEELAAYLQILDWIKKTGGRGAAGGGGPLSSLLTPGQKVPAEMRTRNWPSERQTPRTWIQERLKGSNVPGARRGQWMDTRTGKFATTPWRGTKTLKNIPYDVLKYIQSGKIPREFKSLGEIKKDVHSIASAKANQALGPPKRGEAFNSAARQSALLKKGLGRLALKGIPIVGAGASAVSDAHRFYTDPTYTTPAYLLDQAENVGYLGGWGTGLLGSGGRYVGEKALDVIGEATGPFSRMSPLEKYKWIISQKYR